MNAHNLLDSIAVFAAIPPQVVTSGGFISSAAYSTHAISNLTILATLGEMVAGGFATVGLETSDDQVTWATLVDLGVILAAEENTSRVRNFSCNTAGMKKYFRIDVHAFAQDALISVNVIGFKLNVLPGDTTEFQTFI